MAVIVSACGSSSNAPETQTSPTSSGGPTQAASLRAKGDPAWVTGRVATGSQPCGILGAAGQIWVSDFRNDRLVSVEPNSLHVGPDVKVGSKPCGLAYGGGSVWVEDYGSAQVTRVNARTEKVEHTYRVGGSPYDVTFAGERPGSRTTPTAPSPG